MAEVRELTIPLRAAWSVTRNHRANRAISEIKKHVSQHMKKTEDEKVWIDEEINKIIWARGAQKPPRKIRVICTREEGFNIDTKRIQHKEANFGKYVLEDTQNNNQLLYDLRRLV